jgi:TRAP-type C4-dicarboxylate transport system permease small subunit
MLAMHVFVLEGGMTPSNLGVDVAVIACGLVMLFARGGLSVALVFFASLCVSVFDVTLLLGTYQSVTAAGSQGFQTLLSSMAWVSVIGMVLVLVGFLAALVSLFRRS